MTNEETIRRVRENARRFWLMKTEPGECSIDDALAAPVSWFGIRNYQARNFIRDDMSVGDGVLFYHSSCPEPGIVGLSVIDSDPYPDALQFDPENEYFDAKSSKENPRWLTINVKGLFKVPVIGLAALREHPELADMPVLRRGNRLSITPVTAEEFRFITDHLF